MESVVARYQEVPGLLHPRGTDEDHGGDRRTFLGHEDVHEPLGARSVKVRPTLPSTPGDPSGRYLLGALGSMVRGPPAPPEESIIRRGWRVAVVQ